ncbi:hypothetical protein LZ30DRAFT_298423 [Colletotrichum cereale]|nr:hypothetical protein LZ30DRAFT_298423 [Colletotrichum cereale]
MSCKTQGEHSPPRTDTHSSMVPGHDGGDRQNVNPRDWHVFFSTSLPFSSSRTAQNLHFNKAPGPLRPLPTLLPPEPLPSTDGLHHSCSLQTPLLRGCVLMPIGAILPSPYESVSLKPNDQPHQPTNTSTILVCLLHYPPLAIVLCGSVSDWHSPPGSFPARRLPQSGNA